MAQANVKLTVDASQATRALKGVQAQTTGLQNNLGRLKAAFAGVAFTAVAKQAVSTASNFQALQLRMKVLTSELVEFAQAQELVAKAQDKFKDDRERGHYMPLVNTINLYDEGVPKGGDPEPKDAQKPTETPPVAPSGGRPLGVSNSKTFSKNIL